MLVKTEGVERLTRDHKPNDPEEKKRVEGVGGQGVVRLPKSFSKLFCTICTARVSGEKMQLAKNLADFNTIRRISR